MPKHLGLWQKRRQFRPQRRQAQRRTSAASSTGGMRMMALCISRDAELWAGHLSRAVAPGLDELHGAPSYFLPKLGKNSLSGWEIIAPVITGGMAAENVLCDIIKIAVIQILLDRQK